ncbi:serine hydrolase FSH [Podospora australis]|uniref:Serine hydrolase FSH n=1 Tax=Podospora australis TaxID=1536484 RepID=A0AAN6WSG7_9PEZI|nr:serine hydrolase FSH [Podospora australis]
MAAQKPKILCLHGAGTNATIFRIQNRYLSSLLSPHFELVYIEGFHPCPAGPGVLPFFEGIEPYYKWLPDTNILNSSPGALENLDGNGKVVVQESLHWEDLPRLVSEYNKQGEVVGILGFSQGAKVGFHLARYLQRHQPGKIKFFVAICGTSPFQGVGAVSPPEEETDPRAELVQQSLTGDAKAGLGRVKGVMNIHVIGAQDKWRKESEGLVEFFEKDDHKRKVVRFGGGHQCPPEDKVNKEIVGYILEALKGGEEWDDGVF